jgi:hypothetical protein
MIKRLFFSYSKGVKLLILLNNKKNKNVYLVFNLKFQYLIFSFSIAKFAVLAVGIDNID